MNRGLRGRWKKDEYSGVEDSRITFFSLLSSTPSSVRKVKPNLWERNCNEIAFLSIWIVVVERGFVCLSLLSFFLFGGERFLPHCHCPKESGGFNLLVGEAENSSVGSPRGRDREEREHLCPRLEKGEKQQLYSFILSFLPFIHPSLTFHSLRLALSVNACSFSSSHFVLSQLAFSLSLCWTVRTHRIEERMKETFYSKT